LATSDDAFQESLLLRQWSDDVTVFLHQGPAPTGTQREHLLARNVRLVGGTVESLIVRDDRLTGLRLSDATVVPIRALLVAPVAAPRRELLHSLGIEVRGGADALGSIVDPTGRSAVDGVWLAGNVGDETAQVVDAASSGSRAAVSINADLVLEDVARAVAARRAVVGPHWQTEAGGADTERAGDHSVSHG
jgi:thioredoxin reductase